MNFILILGIIAFLQVTFIPGWIILFFLGIKEHLPERILGSFGLSLIANYSIIFALASFHLYLPSVYSAIIFCEIITLLFIYRKKLSEIRKISLLQIANEYKKMILEKKEQSEIWLREEFKDSYHSFFMAFSLITAFLSFAYVGYVFIENLGTVFKLWDPILSWNRWAVELSLNALPKDTWEYPQLIPANWSLFYVLIGSPIQFFAKSIMPLFLLGIISSLFIFGIRKKTLAFILAVPATVLLMRVLNGSEITITEGYVDTALSFFGTVSILNLLSIEKNSTEKQITKNLLIGALFACGAAMTKQGGVYLAILYPLVAWCILKSENIDFKKQAKKYIFIYVGIFILLVCPFYVYKELSFTSHQDTSVIPQIMDQLYGKSTGINPIKQLIDVFIFLGKKTYGIFPFFFFLIPFSLKNKKFKYLVSFILIPYTLIWVYFVCYDTRNLSLILPFLALGASITIERIITDKKNLLTNLLNGINPFGFIVLVLALLLLSSGITSKKIIESSREQERQLYDSELSMRLSDYFENTPDTGKIYTNSPFLFFLPATKNRMYSPNGGYSHEDDFKNYFAEINQTEVSYVFAMYYTDKKIMNDIEEKIQSKKYSLIFRLRGYLLVKTDH